MRPYEKSASRHSPESGTAQSAAENLLGDFCALLQQLGVRGTLLDCDSPVPFPAQAADLASLQSFLESYLTEILLPLELPAVAEALRPSPARADARIDRAGPASGRGSAAGSVCFREPENRRHATATVEAAAG